MQIKRFEAQDMTEALRKVKKEFGPDAVILSAKSIRNNSGIFSLIKHPGVEVTAATDTNYKEQNGSKFTSGKGWSIYRKQPGKAGVADMPKKNKTIRSFRVRKELMKNIYHPEANASKKSWCLRLEYGSVMFYIYFQPNQQNICLPGYPDTFP